MPLLRRRRLLGERVLGLAEESHGVVPFRPPRDLGQPPPAKVGRAEGAERDPRLNVVSTASNWPSPTPPRTLRGVGRVATCCPAQLDALRDPPDRFGNGLQRGAGLGATAWGEQSDRELAFPPAHDAEAAVRRGLGPAPLVAEDGDAVGRGSRRRSCVRGGPSVDARATVKTADGTPPRGSTQSAIADSVRNRTVSVWRLTQGDVSVAHSSGTAITMLATPTQRVPAGGVKLSSGALGSTAVVVPPPMVGSSAVVVLPPASGDSGSAGSLHPAASSDSAAAAASRDRLMPVRRRPGAQTFHSRAQIRLNTKDHPDGSCNPGPSWPTFPPCQTSRIPPDEWRVYEEDDTPDPEPPVGHRRRSPYGGTPASTPHVPYGQQSAYNPVFVTSSVVERRAEADPPRRGDRGPRWRRRRRDRDLLSVRRRDRRHRRRSTPRTPTTSPS